MGREGGGGKGPKGGQGFFLEPETWIRGEQPGSLSAAGRRRPCENRNSFCARLTFGGGCQKIGKIAFWEGNEKIENHQK